jgi:hypothetical protein
LCRSDHCIDRSPSCSTGAVRQTSFVAAPVWRERIVEICRLDGNIDANTGLLKILEHNADRPAGTLCTPRLNRVIRVAPAESAPGIRDHLAPVQFDDP